MKTLGLLALLLAFAAGGFMAGSRRHAPGGATESAQAPRKILYYVDPMNPTHTSDRPGLAPCGMKLEPVYADGAPASSAAGGTPALAAGGVRISPERQQLAGIRTAEVQAQTLVYRVRLPGRVVVDETRIHRIRAGLGGYLARVFPHSTGSLVRKDELLAELNSPELLPAVQSLLFALETRKPPADDAPLDLEPADSVFDFDLSYQQSLETLRHMGMGQRQLNEVIRTRKLARSIAITAPTNGVLLARQASDDLHVGMGEELFRVADLSRVWVLADVSGWESQQLKPGSAARVSGSRPARTWVATVSPALPFYDDASHTLQVRLELDNPDYELRPDMWVDVELSVALPELIVISADAVFDTGRRQRVFLERGEGCFEPREVTTGRHLGEQVEILHGLTPGERIVTAGNFLLDSESRMKQAAMGSQEAGAAMNTPKDPVCHMTVDAQAAEAAGRVTVHQGRRYYFCNPACQQTFNAEPAAFLQKQSEATAAAGRTIDHLDHRP